MHIEAHKQRLRLMGKALLDKFPKDYRDIDPDTLDRLLSLHDDKKLSPDNLKELYRFYGKDLDQLNNIEYDRAKTILGKINRGDKEVTYQFLRRNGLVSEEGAPSQLGRLYMRIEKIVDGVDRGMDPVATEEFGRPMEKASKARVASHSRKKVLYLENNYKKIVGENTFIDFKYGPQKLMPDTCFVRSFLKSARPSK